MDKYESVSSLGNGHECCFEGAIKFKDLIIAEFVDQGMAVYVVKLLNDDSRTTENSSE